MFLVPGQGRDVLLDLINRNNAFPKPLTLDDIVLSAPRVSPDLPNGTVVTVYGKLGSAWVGQAVVKYQRFDLTSAFLGIRPKISALGTDSLHKMLPGINQLLGTQFMPVDIADVPFNWETLPDTIPITLKATTNSLLYQGEFTLDFTRIRPSLEESMPVVEVDPFGLVETPVPGKVSVAHTTWGVDYSGERKLQRMTVVNGDWSNPAHIATIVRKLFGWSPWPAVDPLYPLLDYATRVIPEANQAFERVIIQRNVNGTTFAGTAYFHYNR